jgi:hypothetical protein
MQDTSLDHAPADVAWGAKAIGKTLGLSERQAFHRLERGQIPCARKFGNTWAASRQALIRLFAPDAA